MFNQSDPYNPYNNPYQNPYNSNLRVLLGCAGMILGVLLVCASVIWYLVLRLQNVNFVPDIQGVLNGEADLESFKPTLMLVALLAMGIVGLYLAIGRRGRRVVGRLISAAVTIALVIGLGFMLFYSIFINPNIDMSRTGFTRASVSIDVGDTVHFKNAADGVTQVLCIGLDQKCEPNAKDAPEILAKGQLSLAPGQTVDVTFYETGYFTITSKTTPHMNMQMHVTHSSSD